MPQLSLSLRNRLLVRSFELRSCLRFGRARAVRSARTDWPSAVHAMAASLAVLGGCHSVAHTVAYRHRVATPPTSAPAPDPA